MKIKKILISQPAPADLEKSPYRNLVNKYELDLTFYKFFEIVGISFDQQAAPWKTAVQRMGMKWPQLSDLGGWQSAAVEVYGVYSIPSSILFDKKGRVIAHDLRGEELGAKLKELYGF